MSIDNQCLWEPAVHVEHDAVLGGRKIVAKKGFSAGEVVLQHGPDAAVLADTQVFTILELDRGGVCANIIELERCLVIRRGRDFEVQIVGRLRCDVTIRSPQIGRAHV